MSKNYSTKPNGLKKLFTFGFTLSLLGIALFLKPASAATNNSNPLPDEYFRARVLSIETTSTGAALADSLDQTGTGDESITLQVEIINGKEKGKKVSALYEPGVAGKLNLGDTVVVAKTGAGGQDNFYYVIDPYRINRLWILAAIFIAVAIFFGRKKGVFAILGLGISILIIFYYLVPRIINGDNPLLTTLFAAIIIAAVSLYIAHGFSRRTTIAFVGTLISITLAVLVDLVFVSFARLNGAASEESLFLQFGSGSIDLRGILLAGILICVLGVLDDATTAQAASLEEIHRANPSLSFSELYRRGLSVGREHIASCVNTLVLTYVGVSLPMILLLVSNKGSLWVVMNSGFMSEEIVRTLVGSLVLVIAVPLTTFLAAYYYSRWPLKNTEKQTEIFTTKDYHSHHH